MNNASHGKTRARGGGKAGPQPSKEAWLCRTCKGPDGSAIRNFGHRDTCFWCHLHKWVCFGGRPVSNGPPSISTHGEHQVKAAAAATKAATSEIARLKAELAKTKAAVVKQAEVVVVGDSEDEEPSEACDFTVEQLMEHRKLLLGQVKSDHPAVVEKSAQIQLQQQARMAVKPGHIRIAKADKTIRQCRTAIESPAAKRVKIGEDVGLLQTQLLEHDKQAAAALVAASSAEQAKADLLAELQATDCGGALGGSSEKQPSLETVACQLEAGSDEAWLSLGLPISRADVVHLLRKLGSVVAPVQVAGQGGSSGGGGGNGCGKVPSQVPSASVVSASFPAPLAIPFLAPVGSSGSGVSPSAGGGNADMGSGRNAGDESELLDQYMGVLCAHHSLDEHCDIEQQRQLAAKLVTMAVGGKRRLVEQQSQQLSFQGSD